MKTYLITEEQKSGLYVNTGHEWLQELPEANLVQPDVGPLVEALERLVNFLSPLLDVDTGDHEPGWHWKQIEGREIVEDARIELAALSAYRGGVKG